MDGKTFDDVMAMFKQENLRFSSSSVVRVVCMAEYA
jgi:hypothetical protein